jgi:hypothetical protein
MRLRSGLTTFRSSSRRTIRPRSGKRDLDKDAEDFILGRARELPKHHPIKIVIRVPDAEKQKISAGQLAQKCAAILPLDAERFCSYTRDMTNFAIRLRLSITGPAL